MCPIPNGFRDRAILVVWLGRPGLSFPPALLRKGRPIFWEVIVSVILSKKLYMNMCPIPNGFRYRAILSVLCICVCTVSVFVLYRVCTF
jgi:hypothetical protein